MNTEILNLIDKIENIIKNDKRFIKNKEYKFKNKIQKLSSIESDSESEFKSNIIDITPFINLAKLNNNYQPIYINENKEDYDLTDIYNNLNDINNRINKIIS